VPKLLQDEKIKALPVQFIRGKTIDDILIVEEAQNLTKGEMLAILTRLGKTGKIVINGDNEQTDIKNPTGEINGLTYVIELSKKIDEIKWIKLATNHRSDLVGKILDFEYGK
jgi:phosphate starvation-inducible PhoH-like protein